MVEMEMSYYKDKLIILGAFVGSFKCEVETFKPYVDWIIKYIKFPNIVVSTHYNRKFLYDDYVTVIPILKECSVDELGQVDHKHNIINKNYEVLMNNIKNYLAKNTAFKKNDMITYNLGYTRNMKIFESQKFYQSFPKISVDTKDNILYIPHWSQLEEEHKEIYETIKNDVTILGDRKIHLQEHNALLEEPNYSDIVFEQIVGRIQNCSAVITPCSHWTTICNLHKVSVFSWGYPVGRYKRQINNKSVIVPFNNNDIDSLIKCIKKFIKDVKGKENV